MNQADTPPKNIVLIGFMGCGKSTVGRELHHRLGYPLVDMDSVIESRAGKPIGAVFADEGERAFRDMEADLLAELLRSDEPRRIISTGGGVVVREENRPLLRKLGFVVWLHAPVGVILERTARSRDRPLLQGPEAADRARALLAEREPWYSEAAHLQVDTDDLDSGEISTGILESARYFFSGHEM